MRGTPAFLLLGLAIGFAAGVLILAPLLAGVCWLANVFIEHDEPSYLDLWRGARRMYGRAVALGAIQGGVKSIILVNIAFYLTRGSFFFLLLAVVFVYVFVFWMMQMVYHYPLLVAAEWGLLKREDEGRTPISAILRNALVLSVASPGYSFGIVALLSVFAVPCVISGAGLALILPGFSAFITVQATRDQLVRYGHLAPPPDLDEPIPDERWRVT